MARWYGRDPVEGQRRHAARDTGLDGDPRRPASGALLLAHGRGSPPRLRADPRAAWSLVRAGDVAFTACGRAAVVLESLPGADSVAAVAMTSSVSMIRGRASSRSSSRSVAVAGRGGGAPRRPCGLARARLRAAHTVRARQAGRRASQSRRHGAVRFRARREETARGAGALCALAVTSLAGSAAGTRRARTRASWRARVGRRRAPACGAGGAASGASTGAGARRRRASGRGRASRARTIRRRPTTTLTRDSVPPILISVR
jgi:hypothetical protein